MAARTNTQKEGKGPCIETYCMPGSELNLSICLFHANVHTHTHSRDGRSGVSFLYFYPYSHTHTHTHARPSSQEGNLPDKNLAREQEYQQLSWLEWLGAHQTTSIVLNISI